MNTKEIDRAALVNRHAPVLRKLESASPLSVGNGEFAFTCDVTGLQTFPREYETAVPLCTMAQWGWHTAPNPHGYKETDLRLTQFETHGRQVGYMTDRAGQSELYQWLRENPHRLHLGRIGLQIHRSDGSEMQPADMTGIEQRLDLWRGQITSRFKVAETTTTVRTTVHPTLDLLAVSIESDLIRRGKLSVALEFSYGSPSVSAADWESSEKHQSQIAARARDGVRIDRKLDADRYSVDVKWVGSATLEAEGVHRFVLTPDASGATLNFVVAFSPDGLSEILPDAAAAFDAATQHWEQFWQTGAAVELADSRDARAPELERRIVLSQYLTAIQCAGSMPPQETGLTVNSWHGKFHLEMHWWHAAHFALWNRLPLLEKSLGWYIDVLPSARERAWQQGYRGARWAKMTAPDGRDSPSHIGTLLIWQQPHPIFFAEQCYRSRPDRATLDRYRLIVEETAGFMASYAFYELSADRYVLGPPMIPAQENHPPRETWNATFELEYWRFGLETANRWRERLGLNRHPLWDTIVSKLSPLPVENGVYLAHENCPQTYTERNRDHPTMLGALGILTGQKVDRETMRRTLHKVMAEWQWNRTWGWDYPMTAMTAARLGESEIAVTALLMETEKNHFLPNGHNPQYAGLPLYLPANGGLLYAIGMMAGGWKGAPQRMAPGFPADGSWNVQAENFNRSVLDVGPALG